MLSCHPPIDFKPMMLPDDKFCLDALNTLVDLPDEKWMEDSVVDADVIDDSWLDLLFNEPVFETAGLDTTFWQFPCTSGWSHCSSCVC